MVIAGRVSRSEFLWAAGEDLGNNVRTEGYPPVSGRVCGKKEEMVTAGCPCSPEEHLHHHKADIT